MRLSLRAHSLLAIIALPVTATVIVPLVIGSSSGDQVTALSAFVGGVLIITGLSVLVATISLLARMGKGTLAPWKPTQHLVVQGPYRLMRNPMITGVTAILLGEALAWRSWPLLVWTGLFVIANHVNLIFIEEPSLSRRFGAEYEQYKQTVPRWVPRLKFGRGT